MKTESLDKKYEEKDKDSIYEDFEITLTEKESEKLIDRLEQGPNDKAKTFLKESIAFYEEMKNKAMQFKEERL